MSDNKEVLKRIKNEFPDKKKNIQVPRSIEFSIERSSVTMKLSIVAICSNMQKDDGAFEGWALILKRWGKFETVFISWQKPDLIDNGHYQRFLFRLKHFCKDFHLWFSIAEDCELFLNDLKIKEHQKYLLNIPSKRGKKRSSHSEAVLEHRFVNGDLKTPLCEITNADYLQRQLPVGVFESKLSKGSSIFTGGKSAIDIWGISKSNELLVFELKADNNEMVGIVSELYFYVCVLQNLKERIFVHEKCFGENEHLLRIVDTKKINAYFLAPTLHPLIDNEVLKLLNEVTPDELTYRYIRLIRENDPTLGTNDLMIKVDEPEKVFEILAEGGSICISRQVNKSGEKFIYHHNEFDPTDEGLDINKKDEFATFEQPFQLINGRYPWYKLYLGTVHPDYVDYIINELIDKLNKEEITLNSLENSKNQLEDILQIELISIMKDKNKTSWSYIKRLNNDDNDI